MENIADNIEEIEEEYMILKELSIHPNIPNFFGLYMKPGLDVETDQLWFVMEVSVLNLWFEHVIKILMIQLKYKVKGINKSPESWHQKYRY